MTVTPHAIPLAPTIDPNNRNKIPHLQKQCLEISSELPPNNSMKGILVFTPSMLSDQAGSIFMFDLDTGNKISISHEENEWLNQVEISPDKTS